MRELNLAQNGTNPQLDDFEKYREVAETWRESLYVFGAEIRRQAAEIDELRAELAAMKGSPRAVELAEVRRMIKYRADVAGDNLGNPQFTLTLLLIRAVMLLVKD